MRYKLIGGFILIAVLMAHQLLGQSVEKHTFNYGAVRLEDALFELTEIYGITFSYSSNEIPVDHLIILEAKVKTLDEVLTKIFPPLHISYKRIGKGITLTSIPLRQNIRGKVIDKDSGEPLVGVNIVIEVADSVKGGTTNEQGYFFIPGIKVGRHAMKATYIGYESIQLPDVLVYTGKEPMISISMKESSTSLQEIIVRPQLNSEPTNSFSLSSGRIISIEETKRFASNFNDVARAITAYPGIHAAADMTNNISVRGNSPNSLQWRLEGVEIPSPNHFSAFGGSGGAISMLSISLLDNSDFYSGAFASEYGNALSGIMDMKLRKGNHEKAEKSFQLSFLGIDAAAEGPFKKGKKSSYLANYRYSTAGVLVDLGALPSGAVPTYQDLSFNLSFPSSSGSLNIWGVTGNGIFNQNSSGSKANIETNSLIGGITYSKNLGNGLSITTTASGTYTSDRVTETRLFNDKTFHETLSAKNTSESFRVSTQLNKKFSSRSLLRTGFIVSHRNYQISQSFMDFADNNRIKNPLSSDAATDYIQAYAQWKKTLYEKFTLNAGLHGIYLTLNQKYSVEPRVGLSYQLSENGSVAMAVGLHSQIQPLTLYYQKFSQADGSVSYLNKNLDLSKALHYVVSYNRQFGRALHARLEAYYQRLYQIPVYNASAGIPYNTTFSAINIVSGYFNNITVNTDPIPLANNGTGENYGLEFSLEKNFSHNYYFMFNGTLYQSHYRGSDGILRNTAFNGQYIFNALAGKEYRTGIRKANVVELNARISWSGNNPQTPIDIVGSQNAGRLVYDYSRSYEVILPDYFRLDLHVGFRKSRPKAAHIWSFDIRNFTNRQNPWAEYLDFRHWTIGYNYQLGFVPVLSYRIEF